MTRNEEIARRSKSHKQPNTNSKIGNPQDAPPLKKAKKNPPSSSIPKPTSITQVPSIPTPTSAPEPSNNVLPTLHPTSTPDLGATHDLTPISIISSTSIQKKVIQILSTLSYPVPANEKPKVVCMKAKAGVASKMISVAEIAKREIGKECGKWFQYNCVEGFMGEFKERPKKNAKRNGDEERDKGQDDVNEKGVGVGEMEDGDAESEEESTAFETMKTPFERANEGKVKVRAVPVMSLYLSRVRIDGLRKAYGEQTNALPAL